jgi:O-antigen ligase
MFFDFFSKILHWDSLIIRLEVYFNSLNIIFNNFFPLIFGEGLGFLDSDDPRSMLYRTNSSGIIEGTVDSQYMNMLIETGLIGLCLVLILVISIIIKLLITSRFNRDIYNLIVPILSYIMISALTQKIGLAKLSWIVPILFVILLKQRNKKSLGLSLKHNN